MFEHRFIFPSQFVRIVDGDTFDAYVDQGMRNYRTERIRLLGINTPELHAKDPIVREAAKEAKQAASIWFGEALAFNPNNKWPLLIETEKDDAFGRYLGIITRNSDGEVLNAYLLANGFAVPYVR